MAPLRLFFYAQFISKGLWMHFASMANFDDYYFTGYVIYFISNSVIALP